MKRMAYFLPLFFLVALVLAFAVAVVLQRDPSAVESAMIDKPMPAFSLPSLFSEKNKITEKDFGKNIVVVNFFASWCLSCKVEHQTLMELKNTFRIPVYGIDHKDTKAAALGWLKREGNPYTAVAFDPEGRLAVDMGVTGVPETFIVDGKRRIRFRYVGAISEDDLYNVILPMIKKIGEEG